MAAPGYGKDIRSMPMPVTGASETVAQRTVVQTVDMFGNIQPSEVAASAMSPRLVLSEQLRPAPRVTRLFRDDHAGTDLAFSVRPS